MSVLVTGAAGFIGYHVAEALLARGETVLGVDNLNDYYDVRLKEARLERLFARPGFRFHRIDISDRATFERTLGAEDFDRAVHLAAQAGVRHSIEHPFDYVQANLVGHMVVLEHVRHRPGFRHLVYASSSSVYGGNTVLPFSETQRVDRPVSLYAATKRANELVAQSYAHLYRLPQTGLRFFTVYGPWGRPDMAIAIFTKAMLADEPIRLFNHGQMRRDFTYIDDLVAGILAVLDGPPGADGEAPHRVYNIGNNRPEELLKIVELLERATNRKAERLLEPMQPGDVPETFADIDAIRHDHGFEPRTPIEVGIPRFVDWYRRFHGIA